MFSSLAYFIIALALVSQILVSAAPLAPIPYPNCKEPVDALPQLHENNNHDIFEVMTFEAPRRATQIAEGCLQNKQ